jgi:ATP phosphoribosyltransferase regulatory subunit
VTVDLGDARGFEYYTGIRFAAYVPGCSDAAARGGRYDQLIARYGRAARATGFAVDVEAVAVAEDARGAPIPDATPVVLVVERRADGRGGPRRPGRSQARPRPVAIAAALRKAGARAAVDLGDHDGDAALLAYAAGRKVVVLDGKRARVLANGAPPRAIAPAALAAAARGDGAPLAAELGLSASRRRTSWPSW